MASTVERIDEGAAERAAETAVHRAVAYADIFDYPLTRDEIFIFSPSLAASCHEIERSIDRLVARGALSSDGRFVYAPGRGSLVALRLARQEHAAVAWRRARRYGRILWALPYVRMVAVTGSLAVNNVEPGDDIDYMIVTETGRLWIARGMAIAVTRLGRLFGDTLCPNYLISSRALRMDQQNHYVAHELVQMVPLHGKAMATRLWDENSWCREMLPNARCAALEATSDAHPFGVQCIKALAQTLLRLPPGDRIEQWEQRRKIARLSRQVPPYVQEALYTADVCKGHDHGHGSRILELWESHLADM